MPKRKHVRDWLLQNNFDFTDEQLETFVVYYTDIVNCKTSGERVLTWF